MSVKGDPSRRPSNERSLLPPVDALIWIECGSCLGDGWHYPWRGRQSWKYACPTCEGRGRRQIPALLRRPEDRIVAAPVGWNAT